MKLKFAKKAIIQSVTMSVYIMIMCGSNFYGSDVRYDFLIKIDSCQKGEPFSVKISKVMNM